MSNGRRKGKLLADMSEEKPDRKPMRKGAVTRYTRRMMRAMAKG
jgi:hypothetical protein